MTTERWTEYHDLAAHFQQQSSYTDWEGMSEYDPRKRADDMAADMGAGPHWELYRDAIAHILYEEADQGDPKLLRNKAFLEGVFVAVECLLGTRYLMKMDRPVSEDK